MTNEIPTCCGQSIVGVRASGQDHYESKLYYCRCNKCKRSSPPADTLRGAIRRWREMTEGD